MLGHQPFQGGTVYFVRRIKGTGRTNGSENSRIEIVKFGVAGQIPFCPFGENRQSKSQKQVIEYGKIAL